MSPYWPHSDPEPPQGSAVAARVDAVSAAIERLAERAAEGRLHFAGDVSKLLDEMTTSTWVARQPAPFDGRPSEWHDPSRPLESAGKWPPSARHETTAPGLLVQLRDQVNAAMRVPADGVTVRSAPDSRPPDGVMDFLAILTEVEAGAVDLWQKARKDLGLRPSMLLTSDELGIHTADPTPENALRGLTKLVHAVDDALAVKICRDVHSWVSAAMVTLSYTAPVVTLQQRCWYCETGALKVRSDASSDLWCDNDEWHDQHDDVPRRWPRATWLMMLQEGGA